MKWLNLLLIGFVVLALNACERHSASELELIQMESEHSAAASNTKKASESTTPTDETKPAPGYLQ